jgi:hypothetical protein
MRLGILPARIDKYLVLPAPGLSHRGDRRAEHATDRREHFTGFGACLGRLIRRDATKPPIDREMVRAASLAQAEWTLVYQLRMGSRLAVSSAPVGLRHGGDDPPGPAEESVFRAINAAAVISDGVVGGTLAR